MKISRAELVKLQQAIAEGRAPTPPSDGEFYWHPKMRLGLRLYNSRRGTWLVKYRNERGLEKTHKIGDAAVLNVTFAEAAARKVLGRVAHGEDPQGDRQAARARPTKTVGALCDEFFQEARAGHTRTQYAHSTLRGYVNAARLHLGVLRGMQADELDAQAVVNRIREINKQHGAYSANHFRALLASVYNWARTVYPKTIVLNPVTGTWRPNQPESTGQALTIEQLGAIWRACETLEAMAVPMCRNGQVAKWSRVAGADDDLIGIMQAAKLANFDRKTLANAVRDGKLSLVVNPQRVRPAGTPAHGRIPHCTTVGELNRYIDALTMRSRRGDYAKIVRLLILLGCRFSEIAALRRSEFDLDKRFLHIKTKLPDKRRRIKSRGGKTKDLVLYLPQAAVDIIASVKGDREMLFGSVENGILSNGVGKDDLDDIICSSEGGDPQVLRDWRKMISATSRQLNLNSRNPEVIKAVLKTAEGRALYEKLVPKPWRHHWLRHSFITHLKQTLHIRRDLVEAMANHAEGGQAATYTHTTLDGKPNEDFLAQQKPALDEWAKIIREAADRIERKAVNVTSLFPAKTAA